MPIDGTEMGSFQPAGWVWEAGREAERERKPWIGDVITHFNDRNGPYK